MMQQVVFLTSAPDKYQEVAKLLSDFAPALSVCIIPPSSPSPSSSPSSSLKKHTTIDGIIQEASEAIKRYYTKTPCFLEMSGLILDADGCGGSVCTASAFADMGEDEFVKQYNGSTGRACVVVAYTDNGVDVQIFQGELEGKVVPARGSNGLGWDRVWQPDGYSHTLSEMSTNKFVITMRYKPYIELAYILRGKTDYQGVFEVHITVDGHNSTHTLDNFKLVCDKLGCKAILIELPTGVMSHHLMTSSYHRGALKDVQLEAFQLSQSFVQNGFNITRLKIEAMLSNVGVPLTDADATFHSSENYFEFHIKLLLPPGTEIEKLQELCTEHGAKLSNNAFKVLASGFSQRFVTLRKYGGGKQGAEAKYLQCLNALAVAGYNIVAKMREYAVYDTNVSLDSGWIDRSTTVPISTPHTSSLLTHNIRSS